MKATVLHEDGVRQLAIVFDRGDRVIDLLKAFAKERNLSSSRFTGIGAFEDVMLGFFDPEAKQFKHIHVREQVEVLSLTGNIAFTYSEPKIHAHVIVGKSDGTAHGGHLIEAVVRPTLEVMLTETPKPLQRQYDPETGLATMRL
ncbi:MAG: DNA-binding protein [Planctomycetes bacterium]|nr:DNA-binding protein [Planctomycetota bacterium]